MASFQAKMVWKRPRKTKNKNYRFVSLFPYAKFKFPKKLQKSQKKLKKSHFGLILSQNSTEKNEKERK